MMLPAGMLACDDLSCTEDQLEEDKWYNYSRLSGSGDRG